MTDVLGVPVFGALVVIGSARGGQKGRLFTVGGGKGAGEVRQQFTHRGGFLFTCLRKQKHISLCARYSTNSHLLPFPLVASFHVPPT